jgi:hypothetical protein
VKYSTFRKDNPGNQGGNAPPHHGSYADMTRIFVMNVVAAKELGASYRSEQPAIENNR